MLKTISKNQCLVACGLASAFFGGMLYISLNPYKYDILQKLLSTLDSEQLNMYRAIHKERMQIYLLGLVLGLLLGFIYLNINQSLGYTRTCTFVAIVMGVNYLFYMVYPKSTYLVRHLKTQEQLDAWQLVYRSMQYRQYMGMLLGLVAYVLFSLI